MWQENDFCRVKEKKVLRGIRKAVIERKERKGRILKQTMKNCELISLNLFWERKDGNTYQRAERSAETYKVTRSL